MIQKILNEFSVNFHFYMKLLAEHIGIIAVSISIAVVVGLWIGILISKKPKLANYIISVVNIVYTIPSIALLGFLISLTGIGNTTAIIALTIYGLLPIVRSTYVGITTIDPSIIEASQAMGSKELQILYKIKLPLAFPVIFSSIRNMVIMTVALAGIASFVGAGGLGVAIYRGITTNNEMLILVGSIIIALLALVLDGILGIFEKLVLSHKLKKIGYKRFTAVIVAVIVGLTTILVTQKSSKDTIEIASKPTSESYILAEIAGELIMNETDLDVNITHGIGGGTANIHPAIEKGEFDIYPEYTGTSWQIVLKKDENYTNDKFETLNKAYEESYGLTWRGLLGFNNTYSLGIRKELADQYNIETFSDLAQFANQFTFGAEYDFFEREDGYKALMDAYKLNFKKVRDMDNGLKYQALFDGKLDVMTVFTTDGQLSDSRIKILRDDKEFYPKYIAGFVIRKDIIKKYPELEEVFKKLENSISEMDMAEMNYRVEIGKESPRDVAISFLKDKGLWRDKDE